jgi:hypothetical protein
MVTKSSVFQTTETVLDTYTDTDSFSGSHDEDEPTFGAECCASFDCDMEGSWTDSTSIAEDYWLWIPDPFGESPYEYLGRVCTSAGVQNNGVMCAEIQDHEGGLE